MDVKVVCLATGKWFHVSVTAKETIASLKTKAALRAFPQTDTPPPPERTRLFRKTGEGFAELGVDLPGTHSLTSFGVVAGETILAEFSAETPEWKEGTRFASEDVTCGALSPCGRYYAFCSWYSPTGVHVIDLQTGSRKRTASNREVRTVTITNRHVAYATEDNRVTVVERDTLCCVGAIRHDCSIESLSATPCGEYLIAAGWDTFVHRIVGEFECVLRISEPATCVRVSPCTSWVACLSDCLHLFDLQTGDVVRELVVPTLPEGKAVCMEFSPCGKHLAVAVGCDVVLLSTANGAHLATLCGHVEEVADLCWSHCGGYVFSAATGDEKNLIKWDAPRAVCAGWLDHALNAYTVSVSHDMRHVVCADVDSVFVSPTDSWVETVIADSSEEDLSTDASSPQSFSNGASRERPRRRPKLIRTKSACACS